MMILESLALFLGLYMAWNIGANDVANAMGTSVGSKALNLKKAVLIAAILEFSGAFFVGSNVSETIQRGIISIDCFQGQPQVFVLGMIGALLSTGILLQMASYFALPVSTTHAIVGSVIGFGCFVGGVDAIQWREVGWISLSWICSPLLSGLLSYLFFSAIQKMAPRYVSTAGFSFQAIESPFERRFAYLQVGSACLVAFAHGANDVSNAIGPVAAILGVLKTDAIQTKTAIPSWLLAFGGLGIVLGLATWGWRVIDTIGKKITELTPSRGFAAEFGTALTVLFASKLGLPISTTHALVGAVFGVGLTRGSQGLNFEILRNILLSWVVTLPLCALFSVLMFYLLRLIFL